MVGDAEEEMITCASLVWVWAGWETVSSKKVSSKPKDDGWSTAVGKGGSGKVGMSRWVTLGVAWVRPELNHSTGHMEHDIGNLTDRSVGGVCYAGARPVRELLCPNPPSRR